MEAAEARLSGSFRLSQEAKKAVVYVREGKPVFAVSNQREHRLFEVLLKRNLIPNEDLTQIKDFTNDMVLAKEIIAREIISKQDVDGMMADIVGDILKTAILWDNGEWVFSPFARIKDDIEFESDLRDALVEYARNLPEDKFYKRFASVRETFTLAVPAPLDIELQPREAFILSRFEPATPLHIQDIRDVSGLPDSTVLVALYTLWMGGCLVRGNWNPAFNERKLTEIRGAKLTLRREAVEVKGAQPEPEKAEPAQPENLQPQESVEVSEAEEMQLLENYLTRVEDAESYYEMLEVPVKAALPEIKAAYFSLAKSFHPDRFRKDTDPTILQRVQDCFSEIARAYETLKDKEARESYDFKLRKHLETLKEKQRFEAAGGAAGIKEFEAKENFDKGFDLLKEGYFEDAVPYLARAAQMFPQNAGYRAFYGKVLSTDGTQRHKAESEFQAALKIDPQNETYRLMLAEFYIDYNLLKRAEGELKRILTINPENMEAEALLDSLAVQQ